MLRLDGNLLSEFPIWQLASNPLLTSLSLANNLWSCNCDFLNHFLVYQKKIGNKISDKSDVRCVTDHYLGEAVTPLENVICADTTANNVNPADFQSVTSTPLDYTPILVSVLIAVVMIIIGKKYCLLVCEQLANYLFIFQVIWLHSHSEEALRNGYTAKLSVEEAKIPLSTPTKINFLMSL